MKELSIEEKAKAYDKFLEEIKSKFKTFQVIMYDKNDLEKFFSELAEPEDEKIRKELIQFIKNWKDTNNIGRPHDFPTLTRNVEQCDRYIAWLEKQGEQINSSNKEYWRGYREGKQEILDKYAEPKKQGEQKSFSKFKVGDWIITPDNQVKHIKTVSFGNYHFTDGGLYNIIDVDNKGHLWTIQDAKDGDVLAAHECYVIFKEIDGLNIKCYLTYHYLGFNPIFYVDTLQNKEAFQPATKEQRDALMKAMSDAGYTFDFEKKELKKIEQKQEWSEEDERLFISALWHIENSVSNGGKDSGEFEIYNWFKSLKDRVLPQQKWSKEDERNASYICVALDCYYRLREDKSNTNGQENLDKARNWLYNKLKSLRPQAQWKPSNEQIEALESATENCAYSEYQDCLRELLEQLKKLREE